MKDQAQKQNVSNNSSTPGQLQTLKSDNNDHAHHTEKEEVIINKFRKEGFSYLTTIQLKVLPIISRKISCFLVAPTASGRTEAPALPVFTILARQEHSLGTIRAI